MAIAPTSEFDELIQGPLVTWFASCLDRPERVVDFESLADGHLIYEVLVQIDPEPLYLVQNYGNDSNHTLGRIKNFDAIVKNLKALYEEELCQTIIQLPDAVLLGSEIRSSPGVENLKLLLLLLLGCAVQCPNKEIFITRIKELPVEVQHNIVSCIKKVTDDQTIVLTSDSSQQDPDHLMSHVRTLVKQRDASLDHWIQSQITSLQVPHNVNNEGGLIGDIPAGNSDNSLNRKASTVTGNGVEKNHLAVELADWKARLRKLRTELEEKTEGLLECREELEYNNTVITKLRSENSELMAEARRSKAYRDELDALREHAERADRLEIEAQKYRERLSDIEFYRQRIEELREDNKTLMDTREMLESQLTRARQRSENAPRLESEILARDQTINELVLERDAAHEKIQELIDENTKLQLVAREANQNTTSIQFDSDDEQGNSGDNSLSEQLSNNAQARALKLELENRKLQSLIESLKESSLQESSDKILELEKDKKKLAIKCEQLSENYTRLSKQNSELESAFKSALDENSKIQENLDHSRAAIDRQSNDIQCERLKSQELERNLDASIKEKQYVQALCDTIKSRADDLETTLNDSRGKVESLRESADKSYQFEELAKERATKIQNFEKEITNLQKEVLKLKELQEEKTVSLDQQTAMNDQLITEIQQLQKHLETAQNQATKLAEVEQKCHELQSQAAVSIETITTLQNDLITTKLHTEKLKSWFEKLGLNCTEITTLNSEGQENTLDCMVEKICGNQEVIKIVQNILKDKGLMENEEPVEVSTVQMEVKQQCEQLCIEIETLQEQNARLQVDISTITSQVNSLTAQYTALQLANSQLVAEKEDILSQQEIKSIQHATLLQDQVTLRSLHESLINEYEELVKDRELLKNSLRDNKIELRDLREKYTQLEKKLTISEQEKDVLKVESKSLSNLRAEHSKLKDDFRNVYTANERLKADYRTLQGNSKAARTEAGRLHLENTALRGDHASAVTETNKLREKCEMLLMMTVQMDGDRRALMSHASQLLGEYHLLLKHALDGERTHYAEQRVLTDRLHELCRQKNRLEEKIMEHYGKLDSCVSAKKKGFGASLVRRVRKAGSDFISKVPGNRRSWQEDSQLSQADFMLSQNGSGESGNNSDNSIDDSIQCDDSTSKRMNGNGENFSDKQVPSSFIASTLSGAGKSLSIHKPDGKDEPLITRRASLGSTTGSVLSLGSAGTRRTVYLTETDETKITPADNNAIAPKTSNVDNDVENNQGGGTMLVYNRISTVIGSSSNKSTKPDEGDVASGSFNLDNSRDKSLSKYDQQPPSSNTKSKEDAIWYEYGCV